MSLFCVQTDVVRQVNLVSVYLLLTGTGRSQVELEAAVIQTL